MGIQEETLDCLTNVTLYCCFVEAVYTWVDDKLGLLSLKEDQNSLSCGNQSFNLDWLVYTFVMLLDIYSNMNIY
jgi:hypothetical protein